MQRMLTDKSGCHIKNGYLVSPQGDGYTRIFPPACTSGATVKGQLVLWQKSYL